ncbi:MAG: corrinoid protein [Bacteroidales bacterium]|nr:corrinoid protein [Bacteroidales bacterium]
MAELKKIHEAILIGDLKTSVAVTKEALEEGIDPQSIIREYMIPAMDEIGTKFEQNEVFVPELLMAARAMKGSLDLLRPLLAEKGAKPEGKVIIGTVKGDLHDIGKNIVASMLEGGGFEVKNLGVDVPPDKIVAEVQENNYNIVALPALLTTTMPAMKDVIEALKDAGLRDKVKVIIGGPAVTQEFCEEIGADGTSDNANGAVGLARELV